MVLWENQQTVLRAGLLSGIGELQQLARLIRN